VRTGNTSTAKLPLPLGTQCICSTRVPVGLALLSLPTLCSLSSTLSRWLYEVRIMAKKKIGTEQRTRLGATPPAPPTAHHSPIPPSEEKKRRVGSAGRRRGTQRDKGAESTPGLQMVTRTHTLHNVMCIDHPRDRLPANYVALKRGMGGVKTYAKRLQHVG